jgi:hypothetical protein
MYKLLIWLLLLAMFIRSNLYLIPHGERDSSYPKNMNILDHVKTSFQKFCFPL